MTYTDAQRAEGTALALSYGRGGDKRAGKELGIPSRTIRRWVADVRTGSERADVILTADTREQLAARFWSVAVRGTQRMEDALNDPKTPARDVARIVEVSFESHSLLTGGVTERTEARNLNVNADWFGGSDAFSQADLELQDRARDWTASIAEEVLVGYQALKAAGVEEPKIAVDGLAVRAELSGYDMTRVRALLNKIATAQDAGVSPSDILEALTAKARLGGDNVG